MGFGRPADRSSPPTVYNEMERPRTILRRAARFVLPLALAPAGCSSAPNRIGPAPTTAPTPAVAVDIDPIRLSVRTETGLEADVLIVPGGSRVEVRRDAREHGAASARAYLFPAHPDEVRRLKGVMDAHTSFPAPEWHKRGGDRLSEGIVREVEEVGHVRLAEALDWHDAAEAFWAKGDEARAVEAFGHAARAFRGWEKAFVHRYYVGGIWEPELSVGRYEIDGNVHAVSGPMPEPAEWIRELGLTPSVAVEIARRRWPDLLARDVRVAGDGGAAVVTFDAGLANTADSGMPAAMPPGLAAGLRSKANALPTQPPPGREGGGFGPPAAAKPANAALETGG